MTYFTQTRNGRSVWWSWIVVTWLAFLGWVFAQSVLVQRLINVASAQDADLSLDFTTAVNVIAPELMQSYIMSQSIMLVGVMLSIPLSVALVLRDTRIQTDQARIESFSSDTETSTRHDPTRLVLIAATLATILVSILAYRYNGKLIDNSEWSALISRALGQSPLTYGLFLLTFPAGLAFLYLGQKTIHHRTLLSLHTAAKHIRWGWGVQGFIVTWLVLGGVSFVGTLLGVVDIDIVFEPSRFWGFAIVSLLLIPLQSGAEEVVFRGYFNQGLTDLLRNKWVAFTLTSLVFMVMHLSNPEALAVDRSVLPLLMSSYFLFGFAACLLVLFDDGLETAIGVHAGNNCFAAIIINYENSVLPTPSIFITGQDPLKDSVLTIVTLSLIVMIFRTLRRRSGTRLTSV